MAKESPNFFDCETYINLGFSGLVAYWKPQTMLNLLEFINENRPAKRNDTQSSASENKLDRDLDERIRQDAAAQSYDQDDKEEDEGKQHPTL